MTRTTIASLADVRATLTAGRTPSAMDLHLVAMPWPPLDSPYLALGTLSGYVKQSSPRPVVQHHLYLDWYAELRAVYGDLAQQIYATVAEEGAYLGIGDYIFAEGVAPESQDHVGAFELMLSRAGVTLPQLSALRSMALSFVSSAAQRLAASARPGALVGFSSTFTQSVPSLAVANALKPLRPDVRVVLGGANTNAERAAVLLENFPALDYVCVGEGEAALVGLLHNLDADCEGAPVPGIIGRTTAPATSTRRPWIQLDENPPPDMQSYFDAVETTGLDGVIEPRLAFEIGRGCWWGEKHHCTFCGLNGESMEYRRKTSPDVHLQILDLITRHQVLDVIFADNILHPLDIEAVFSKFPPDLDLRMHLEVKGNLRRDDIALLRSHGVWHLQPGIESLARRPLEMMRKGIKPWQNVRFLRNAEELGVTTSWNILTGFPGETRGDYAAMLASVPKLFHLQPPGSVALLGLVRYSPLFNDPSLGVRNKRPTIDNQFTWAGLSNEAIEIMAEVYEPEEVGEDSLEVTADLRILTHQWSASHSSTFLSEDRGADCIRIESRVNGVLKDYEIRDEWAIALYEFLREGRTQRGIARYLSLLPPRESTLAQEFIEWLVTESLIYEDEGCMITLPCRYEDHVPYRLGDA